MIDNIHIQGFRCFEDFKVEKFGRINLLVGKNNSGKTALMQAVYLLSARGAWEGWGAIIGNALQPGMNLPERKLLRHRVAGVFNRGRNAVAADPEFKVSSTRVRQAPGSKETHAEESLRVFVTDVQAHIAKPPSPPSKTAPGQPNGLPVMSSVETTLTVDYRVAGKPVSGFGVPVHDIISSEEPMDLVGPGVEGSMERRGAYVPTGLDHAAYLLKTFADVTGRKGGKDFIIEALRLLVPDAVDVSFGDLSGIDNLRSPLSKPFEAMVSRAIFRIETPEAIIPLNQFGEGTWKILKLACFAAQDEVFDHLFVDEIEDGLHHSVVKGFLSQAVALAERTDRQLFFTTHSEDVVRALAAIAEERIHEGKDPDEIFAHRIQDRRQADGTMRKVCVSAIGTELSAIVDRELEFR